ncbi:uncharacterized protein [Clytia hemisphaerica]|uniref:Cnidarian restricted protein n=1 Tax=Clytia hemisphaerica TaxID=252671 RepID=A0A7M5V6N0_9CNID|eukprot:TCONS_00064777-protein
MNYKLLTSLVLLAVIITVKSERGCKSGYFCCKSNPLQGYCTYQGYVPGGKKVMLRPIRAPVANLQMDAVATYGTYLGYAFSATSAQVDVAALAKNFAKYAEVMSVGLGVFGSVVGIAADKATPTPADIINACNVALEKLTDEVNDQFSNMKDYVDQQIIQQDKLLMNLNYKQYYSYYTGCLTEITEDDMLDCLKAVNRLSGSDSAKFLRFFEHKSNPNWNPSVDDVKRMEAIFIIFRDYADLRIMILLSLSAMYERKQQTTNNKKAAKTYLTELKNDIEEFMDYANFTYTQIYNKHNTHWDYLTETKKCTTRYQRTIKEGWLVAVHTWDAINCGSRFSEFLQEPERCWHDGYVRKQGNCPCSGSMEDMYAGKTSTPLCPMVKYGSNADTWASVMTLWNFNIKRMGPEFRLYREQDLKSLENYWNANIFVNFPVWKNIVQGVEKKLKTVYHNVQDEPSQDNDAVLKRVESAKRWQFMEEDALHDEMALREY